MIQPSLGRIVWFTPHANDRIPTETDGRCAAIVVKVWSDRLVNLVVFDANGNSTPKPSVALVQEDDTKPRDGYFAEWMPYQLEQAKRHEEAARAAASPIAKLMGR